MRKIPLVVCLLLPIAVAVAWLHVFAPTTAWAGPVHVLASALLGAIAIATAIAAIAGAARTQIALAATLLAAQVAIIGTSLAGVQLVNHDMFPSKKLAIVVAAALAIAVYGLARRRLWGRWLGLALGAVGAVSGGLNVINYWPVTAHVDEVHLAWSMQVFEATWVLLVMTLGGALVVANLASAAVHDAFVARARGTTWTSNDRVVGAVRWAILGAFAAVPMLLVYAWLQPIVPATEPTAVALAAAFALGGVLAVRGKLAGALLLVVAGLGLVAQTAATAAWATDAERSIAGYYAIFWLPTAALAIACGVRLARPTVRLLRG